MGEVIAEVPLSTPKEVERGVNAAQESFRAWREMEKVLDIFPQLRDRLKQLGGTLSGGEQQMLAVGRGLMADPKCLMLDEASLGLAPIIIETLFNAIRAINKNGVTILLVEQNAVLALELAKRAYIIQNGVLVSEGAVSELEKTDLIREAYLGTKRVLRNDDWRTLYG